MAAHSDATDKQPHALSDKPPLWVAGRGDSARVAALSLAAAGLPSAVEPLDAPEPNQTDPWQSVLALSPAARTMLETLGVWKAMKTPSCPIFDMRVFGRPANMAEAADAPAHFISAQLGFGAQITDDTDLDHAPLGHIVSRTGLSDALHAAWQEAVTTGQLHVLAKPIDAPPQEAVLIDCHRRAPLWRQEEAAEPLRYDYGASALVGVVETTRPHGHRAIQIFLPDGPLALLPLPSENAEPPQMALVWSLPSARAAALSRVTAEVLGYELAQATRGHMGTLTPKGAPAVQKLELVLAQEFVTPHGVLLGEAAHVVHPLAGQGFNLTLRDAACLADILFDAGRLGLPFHDATMLARYHQSRRADAALTAATTHGLAKLFQGPLAGLGRWGLGGVGAAARHRADIRDALSAQANGGISTANMPRLMRGRDYISTN